MTERELRLFWALCPGLAPATFRRFLQVFGTSVTFSNAAESDWMASVRLHAQTVRRMAAWRESSPKISELEARLNAQNILCVVRGDPTYPENLEALFDPPEVLFARGNLDVLRSPFAVAVVGTRRATGYGAAAAKWIAATVAEAGGIVVSGLALGVDAFGHQAALAAGGPTIAILGCGVDVCYPPAHAGLYAEIGEQGLILSEYAPGSAARKHHFPERNRIIAGISDATVVVQAGERSGALGTAAAALEIGRDVYVVPGPITSQASRGSNQLLFDGAIPLLDPAAFIQERFDIEGASKVVQKQVPEHLATVYHKLAEDGPLRAGELALSLSVPPGNIYATLLELEISHLIEKLPDGRYQVML
ncbi:DNA protecting protein DprA [Alicyclobacillus sacchari]|uniref:DNA protecting protein DprA n=1 Tax=Alicyclobacillus sacchari TaxID=392010 RepID=A0A4R8LS48_9BACL|nr:DNA-processing protein DprA [Alicyclobacillus sacchari]TDY50463.1 DNA protecting protein DprA [Alicyclobacillus sacchari]